MTAMGPLHMGQRQTGMRERVLELGGRVEIESNDYGTVVRAVIPFDAPVVSRSISDLTSAPQQFIPPINLGTDRVKMRKRAFRFWPCLNAMRLISSGLIPSTEPSSVI